MSDRSGRADLLGPLPMRPGEIDGAYDATGKSSAEIENDIARTRAQLGTVIETLERKLAPRRLLEQGMDALRDTVKDEGGRLGRAARDNSVPLALIGAGLGWMLFTTARRSGGAARGVADRPDPLGLPDEPAIHATGDSAMRHELAWAGPGAAAADAAEGTAARVREHVARTIDDNPLALGALGLLAGAAIAFLMPVTRSEERFVGPMRERLRDHAQALGRDAIDRAQFAAERAIDAATEAVRDATRRAEESAARQEDYTLADIV